MNIVVPENISTGELKVLPEGVASAAIEKCIVGKSKANKPKVTIVWVIIEEMDNNTSGEPTVGEKVLETHSLQPQAMFGIAGLWKQVTGETLPQGDYNEKEFEALLNETLTGAEFKLVLQNSLPGDGSSEEPRTEIAKRVRK